MIYTWIFWIPLRRPLSPTLYFEHFLHIFEGLICSAELPLTPFDAWALYSSWEALGFFSLVEGASFAVLFIMRFVVDTIGFLGIEGFTFCLLQIH